jgi:hypothetical protein
VELRDCGTKVVSVENGGAMGNGCKILLADAGTVSDELDAYQTNVGVFALGGLKYVSCSGLGGSFSSASVSMSPSS